LKPNDESEPNDKEGTGEKAKSKDSQDSDLGSPSYGQEKRKYEAITGEEDECNVLQIHCKLYAWESKEGNWKEKGKGSLRLNDKKTEDHKLCSRLVMRTTGSLKVILNSSIVVGMKNERNNEHCLSFTNIEGLYMVKGRENDMEQLHSAIDYRLRELSKRMRSEGHDLEEHHHHHHHVHHHHHSHHQSPQLQAQPQSQQQQQQAADTGSSDKVPDSSDDQHEEPKSSGCIPPSAVDDLSN
jgi:hypothetical protein